MQPLLANPALKPTPANIDLSRRVFQEFLTIRASSSLFRLSTLAQVQASLHFLNTGKAQIPGVIALTLDGKAGECGQFSHILVVFNATTGSVQLQDNLLKGLKLQLHPVQLRSADAIVKQSSFNGATGTAVVPGLTTAVFVSNEDRR
jgi:pullulanase